VRQALEELGAEAVRMVLAMIETGADAAGDTAACIELPTELVVRASTAPPSL
jgi:LacI family transcriptional regulator